MAKKKTRKRKSRKTTSIPFYKDQRYIRITGVGLLVISAMIFFALVSYLMTWQVDQDKVLHFSWSIFAERDLRMANWLGRFGAFVACGFMYWGFGVASFLLVALLARFSLKLIRLESWSTFLLPARRMVLLTFFLSLVFSAAFAHSPFPWGGAVGQSLYLWISNFLGSLGLVFFILFLMAASFIWVVNPDLRQWALIGRPLAMQFAGAPGAMTAAADRSTDTVEKRGFKNPFKNFAPSLSRFLGTPTTSTDEKPSAAAATTEEAATPADADKIQIDQKEDSPAAKPTPAKQLELGLDHEIKVDPLAMGAKRRRKKAPIADPSLEINKAPQPDPTLDLFKEQEGPKPKGGGEVEEQPKENYDPKADLSSYKLPPLELLHEYDDEKMEIDKSDLQEQCSNIIETLRNYKIEITKITATIGPTVTLFEIVPAPGIRINKIKNLEDDIALSLSALGIRIIAPIPGKGTVGIEVPNKKRQIVSAREVFRSTKFKEAKLTLPIGLGKTISNEVFVADLAKMPHLLVAGATGQGKSVGINQMLISLLYKMHPSEVKLIMIDPKMVELSLYSRLEKHFMAMLPDQEEPIITDTTKVIHTLNSLCIEMDQRYQLLKDASVRNLKEYNKRFTSRRLSPNKGHRYLPYLVLVIDEFADLIMTAGKEIEIPIARLAQKARAVGIHLILATQRPSVNIITGMIKANFPARLAFKVQQKVDSRTILDTGGADQLTGMGDMLLSAYGKIIRLQCAFVDTPEVERVIEHISAQQGYLEPYILPEYTGDDTGKSVDGVSASDLDALFDDAARLVVGSQSGSTSMLQRKLQLGYNRAGRIMDQMESIGIVGGAQGSKPREVLVFTETELDQMLHDFRNG